MPWHARGWVNLLKFGERFMDYECHIRQKPVDDPYANAEPSLKRSVTGESPIIR